MYSYTSDFIQNFYLGTAGSYTNKLLINCTESDKVTKSMISTLITNYEQSYVSV